MSFGLQFMAFTIALFLIIDFNSGTYSLNDCALDIKTDLFPHIPSIQQQKTSLVTKYIPSRVLGQQQKIPFNIFQTNQFDIIPWKMKYSINSLTQKNPQYTYRFFNGTERRQFMKSQMGEVVLKCYDKLIPNAYKADLWRYSVVYTYGGCYIDIGFMAAASISTLISSSTIFLSSVDDVVGNYALNSAFFCTTPKNKILQSTINLIVQTVKNQQYGVDPISVTGPRRFKTGFLSYLQSQGNPAILNPGFYGSTIQIVGRSHEDGCLQSTFDSLEKEVIFYSKYPDYDMDMNWYTKRAKYWAHWRNNTVYNLSKQFSDIPDNYSISSFQNPEKKNQDFRIPSQYKNRTKPSDKQVNEIQN